MFFLQGALNPVWDANDRNSDCNQAELDPTFLMPHNSHGAAEHKVTAMNSSDKLSSMLSYQKPEQHSPTERVGCDGRILFLETLLRFLTF